MDRSLKNNSIPHLLKGALIYVAAGIISYTNLAAQTVGADNSQRSQGTRNLEQIYLRSDRDIYIAGEVVYFRTVQSGTMTHIPGTISKVVYVDLIDSYRTPVTQVRTGTDGVTGAGSFRIPDTLRTGNYFIRSFTNLMKNHPQALFAYKKISVINPFESLNRIKIPTSDHQADSVVFYLETGFLVSGLETRTGVKCFNSSGDPVITSGIVINADGDTLARFRTDRHGAALFTITPPDTGSLFLAVTDGRGAGRRYVMPPVRNDGLTFRVSEDKKSGALSIHTLTGKGFRERAVMISYNSLSCPPIEREIYPTDNSVVTFAPGTLPEGLAKITVADSEGTELASRWYYHETDHDIIINVSVGPENIGRRQKAELEINTFDEAGNPVVANVFVSAVKAALAPANRYSELSEKIQMPSLQAFSTDLILPGINDYLIFCEVEDSLIDKTSGVTGVNFLPEPEGHLVKGFMRDRNTGEPLAGENLSFSMVGRTARCSFTTTGPEGEFSFPVREYGRREIVIQRLNQGAAGYFVDLADPFLFEMRLDQQPGPFFPDTSRLKELNEAIISMQVRNIYDPFLKKKNVKLFRESYPDFFGSPDRTIVLSDYIELTTMREAFKEIVPGLSASWKNERSSLSLVNRNPGQPFGEPPLVIIDGVPVYDFDRVLDIPSSLVERIEVLNTRYFIGDIILEGIINIVSKKGDLSLLEFDRSVFRQEYDLLLDSYDIVDPDYSSDTLKMSRIPDYRNTLYWNPSVTTDSNGNAHAWFWTSDEPGDYKVIVEGMTSGGQYGRGEVTFRVR